jgi:hypothetical protein
MAVDLNNLPVRLIDEGRDGKYPRLGESAFGDDPRQAKLDYRRALAGRLIAGDIVIGLYG